MADVPDHYDLRAASDYLKEGGFEAVGEWVRAWADRDQPRSPRAFMGETLATMVDNLDRLSSDLHFRVSVLGMDERSADMMRSAQAASYLARLLDRGESYLIFPYEVPLVSQPGQWSHVELSESSRTSDRVRLVCPICLSRRNAFSVNDRLSSGFEVVVINLARTSIQINGNLIRDLYLGRCHVCMSLFFA